MTLIRNAKHQNYLFEFLICVGTCILSHVRVFATTWTVPCQAPLIMGFSRQEYWNGLPFLLQGIFPTQGSNPGLLHCRQILYRLSYKGSPPSIRVFSNESTLLIGFYNTSKECLKFVKTLPDPLPQFTF